MPLAHRRIGRGAPLVLVHGIGSHWQMWRPVLGSLAPGRDVIAIDLPGFGGSAPLPGPPSVPALAAAVAAHAASLGLAGFHVAGNSLGGGVALELGRMGVARSVCALSPIGFWNDAERRYSRACLLAMRASALALASRADGVTRTALRRTAAYSLVVARPWRMPPADAAHALRDLARARGFEATLDAAIAGSFEDGQAIRCPVTVAWAQHDRLLLARPQSARARAALPQARHVVLRGCGHVPTWDDPGQVARVLLEASVS